MAYVLELFTNYAVTTATGTSGSTTPASGTVETWTVTSSAPFAAVTTAADTGFMITDPALPGELIEVTNISGTTWTVIRGAEGTSPVAHANGFTIKEVLSAGMLNALVPNLLPLASGDDGPNIQAAAQAASNAAANAYMGGGSMVSGRVVLAPNAKYNVETTINWPPGCELFMGRGTILAFSGTGPCIDCQGDETGVWEIQGMGSRIMGGCVDGTAVGATATAGGIRVGGQYDIVLEDVTVQNFTSSGTDNGVNYGGGTYEYNGHYPLGAFGISVDCVLSLTEKVHINRCVINNCGTPNTTQLSAPNNTPGTGGGAGIQFLKAVNGATSGSKMYSDIDVHLNQQPGQNGVVFGNGAQLYAGSLRVRGNFWVNPTGYSNAAVLVIGVGNATYSYATTSLAEEVLDISCESTALSGTPPQSAKPYTAWFGYYYNASNGAYNQITNTKGRIRFGSNAFQSCTNCPNFFTGVNTVAGNVYNPSVQFSGRIVGDNNGLAAVSAPVSQPAFGTSYTNAGNDVVVTVWGGGMTGITINGTTMNVGAFWSGPIKMNGTVKVQGSGTLANWAWTSDISQ